MSVLMVICGISCSSTTVDKTSTQEDVFEEALGVYAQGLLAFEENISEGVGLLLESVQMAPFCREFIDDYLKAYEQKSLKELSLDDDVSEYEKLHLGIINAFLPIALKSDNCAYLKLKLIESCLAVNKPEIGAQFLSASQEKNNEYEVLALLKFLKFSHDPDFNNILNESLKDLVCINSCDIQHFAIVSLIENNDVKDQQQLLKHTLQLLKNLKNQPKHFKPDSLVADLINGVLYGSDIGEAARGQSVKDFDILNSNRQWSLLAGILMKQEYFEEAYWVIKHRVLKGADRQWLALYNLARCAQQTGRDAERIKYLEQSYRLRADNSFLRRVLVAAHTSSGSGPRSLELLDEMDTDKDPWLAKLKFYNLKRTNKWHTAWESAENIYNWNDTGQRINSVTSSFATSTIPIYLKVGKPNQLMDRLQLAVKYNPGNINLYNSIAYLLADADIINEWIVELIDYVILKEPENASYLDTIAWVKYKQKKYVEALSYIDKALAFSQEESGVVYLHAGDIYKANGKSKKAVEFWQRALKCDKTLEDKVRKRLENENLAD